MQPKRPLTTASSISSSPWVFKVPLQKLALLGGLASLPVALTTYFFGTVVMTLVALGPFGFLAALLLAPGQLVLPSVVALLTWAVLARYVRREGVPEAAWASLITVLAVVAVFTFRWSLPSDFFLLTEQVDLNLMERIIYHPVTYWLLYIVVGAVALMVAGRVVYLRRSTVWLSLLTVAMACLIGLFVLYRPTIAGVKKGAVSQGISELSWAYVPTYTPPGVVEGKGMNSCSHPIYTAVWYRCEYIFNDFPGYLAPETVNVLQRLPGFGEVPSYADKKNYFQPNPFLTVTVVKDSPELDPYKYHDGKCDYLNLASQGTASVAQRKRSAVQPELRRCVEYKTPGGQKLYYYSYLNYPHQDAIYPIPTQFYVQKDGAVVLVEVGRGGRLEKNSPYAQYYADANFSAEFMKFIDGVQPVGNVSNRQ